MWALKHDDHRDRIPAQSHDFPKKVTCAESNPYLKKQIWIRVLPDWYGKWLKNINYCVVKSAQILKSQKIYSASLVKRSPSAIFLY